MNEKLVNINKISYDPDRKGYLVMLQSFEDNESLQILVGTKAAKQIALAKEGVNFPRPSTHELLLDMIDNFEVKIKKIIITDYKSSTFFAKIMLFNHNYGEIIIDSRPSDAIILSLRSNAPLYVNKSVLSANIKADSIDNNIEQLDYESSVYSNTELMLRKLNQNLEKAIEFEEYEKAAKLRDEISNFKKNIKA